MVNVMSASSLAGRGKPRWLTQFIRCLFLFDKSTNYYLMSLIIETEITIENDKRFGTSYNKTA